MAASAVARAAASSSRPFATSPSSVMAAPRIAASVGLSSTGERSPCGPASSSAGSASFRHSAGRASTSAR